MWTITTGYKRSADILQLTRLFTCSIHLVQPWRSTIAPSGRTSCRSLVPASVHRALEDEFDVALLSCQPGSTEGAGGVEGVSTVR